MLRALTIVNEALAVGTIKVWRQEINVCKASQTARGGNEGEQGDNDRCKGTKRLILQ